MRSFRVLLTGSLCFLLAVGLEFWAYPWAINFGNFTFGFGITLASYLIKREFPRLCRGGSSSLTFAGVHPRDSER